MLEWLKKQIEKGKSPYELEAVMSGLKEEERNLIHSYYHFLCGNYGSAALAFADAVDTMSMEEAVREINILYSDIGDFLCGWELGECCGRVTEWCTSCSCCTSGMALLCGAMFCSVCMKDVGMEGSCCWSFCAGIQDCVCDCMCGW